MPTPTLITVTITDGMNGPRRDDPVNFDTRADEFVAYVEDMPGEYNVFASQVNTLASEINQISIDTQAIKEAADQSTTTIYDNTVIVYNNTNQLKTDVTTLKSDTQAIKDSAVAETVVIRDTTLGYRDQAQTYMNNAQVAAAVGGSIEGLPALVGKAGLPVVISSDEQGVEIGTGFIVPTVMYSDTEFGVTEQGTFTITNFHNGAAYTISALNGSVVVDAFGVITYTAPDPEGSGTDEITIALAGYSTTKIGLTVLPASVTTPSITAPSDSATDIVYEGLQLTASTFDQFPVGYDTHVDTQFQVATDVGFSSVIFDFTAGSAVTNCVVTVGLNRSITYYARVRYNSTSNGWTPWSAGSSFTTAAFVPSYALFNPSGSPNFRLPSVVCTADKVFGCAWDDANSDKLAFASLNTLLSSDVDSKPLFKNCSLYTGNFWGCAVATDGANKIFSAGGGIVGSSSRFQAHSAVTDHTLATFSARTWQHSASNTTMYFTDACYHNGSFYGVGYSSDGTGVALMVVKFNATGTSVEAKNFFTVAGLGVNESTTKIAADSSGVYLLTEVNNEVAVVRCNLSTLAEEASVNLSGSNFASSRSLLLVGNDLIIGTSDTNTLVFAIDKTTFAYSQSKAFITDSTSTSSVLHMAYSSVRNCIYVVSTSGHFFQVSLADFSLMGQARTYHASKIAVGDSSDALYSTGDATNSGDNFNFIAYDGDLNNWPSNQSTGSTFFYTTPTFSKASPPASMATQAMTLVSEDRTFVFDDAYNSVSLSAMGSGSISKGEY